MATYLDPTMEQGRALLMRGLQGPVVMLTLLRFREVADYSEFPDIAPAEPIGGEAAYDIYVEQTTPFLLESGGKLLFHGNCGPLLIGPADEHWDNAILVRQSSIGDFSAFATNEAYLKVLRRQTAALANCRMPPLTDLLPIV